LRTLSKKILAVKSSPTIALNSKAAQLLKEGKPVISFAVGEPDFQTPQKIVDQAIAGLKAGHTKYGAAGGGPVLRKAIADKLKRENHLEFTPEQIVVGIGAKEILFHVMLTLLNEGDEVLIPSPYWVSYADQIVAAGGIPIQLPLPKNFPDQGFDVELIEKYATKKTTAIILNSPNNPTGYVFSKDELNSLGKILSQKDWWIVSDEIYEYLAFDRPHFSLLELFPDLKDRFLYVNGFSKSFAMTGWRVGYVAGPLEVMKLVRSLQSHSSTCLPPFIEEAAVLAIQSGHDLVAHELEILNTRRKLAFDLLKKVSGIQVAEPMGAFYLFADVRAKWASSLSFCEELLNQKSVVVVPGEAFGAPGFFRLSYAVSDAQLREGISRIEQFWSSAKSGGKQ